MDIIKRFSPATFGLALICFFLPFTHISCQGQKVATLTAFGFEAVVLELNSDGTWMCKGETGEWRVGKSEGEECIEFTPNPWLFSLKKIQKRGYCFESPIYGILEKEK